MMAFYDEEEMLWEFDNTVCDGQGDDQDADQQATSDVECDSGPNDSFTLGREIAIQSTRGDRRISPGLDSGHFSGTQDFSNGGAGTNQSDFSLRNHVSGQFMIQPIQQSNQKSSMPLKTSLPVYPTTPGPQDPCAEQTQNLLSPTNSGLKRSYKDYQLEHMKRGKREDATCSPAKPRVITATPLPKDAAYGNLFNHSDQHGQSRGNLYSTTSPSRKVKQVLTPEVTSARANKKTPAQEEAMISKTGRQEGGQTSNALFGAIQQNHIASDIPVKFEECQQQQQQPTKCSPEVNKSLHLRLQNGTSVLEGQGQRETKFKGDNGDQPNNPRDKTRQQSELSEEEEKKRRQQMKNRQYAKESRERKNKKLEALEKENKEKDVQIEMLSKVASILHYRLKGCEINWQLQEVQWFIKQVNGGQGYFNVKCLLPVDADILKDLGNSHFGVVVPPPSQPDDLTSATGDQVGINAQPIVREGPTERTSSCKPLRVNSLMARLEAVGGLEFVKPDQEIIVSNEFIMSDQENIPSVVPAFLVQEDMVAKHRDSQSLVFNTGLSNGNYSAPPAVVTPDLKTGCAQGGSSWQRTTQDGHTGVVGLFGSNITVPSSQARRASRHFDDVSPWCTQYEDNTNSQGHRTQDSRNSQGHRIQDSRNSQGHITQNSKNIQGYITQDSRNSQGEKNVDSNLLYSPTQVSDIFQSDLEDPLISEVFNLSSMDLGSLVSEVTDLS